VAKPRLYLEYPDQLLWKVPRSGEVVDKLLIPNTRCGCAMEEFSISPSGEWIVTRRSSGQGEWGYDVLRAHPLERQAGIPFQSGYMLEMPVFADDESFLLGGYGESWLGGWWCHPEDDFDAPARGGKVTLGWLLRHRLPSHKVTLHELTMKLPSGWLPDDPEAPTWYGPTKIRPRGKGVEMTLPGGVPHRIDGPLRKAIALPTPHPMGKKLLPRR
jgi:hypothetical protein